MAVYRVGAEIDPSGATQGAAKVRQSLRGINTEANSTKKALASAFDPAAFDRTIGGLVARFESLEKNMGDVAKSSAAVVASNDALVKGLDRVTAAADRNAKAMGGNAKSANDNTKSQSSMDAALRRVLQAIDSEAAELQRLNALLADAKRLHDAGELSADRYAKVQDLVTQGVKKGTVSIGQQRAGYTQLGFQIQDITSTLALGINPLVVLAQQGGQTAAALSLALGEEGKAGKVATFLAGPWGSIILAAVSVLGNMAYAAYKTGNALDESLKKMREDAKETEVNRKAKEIFKTTQEGVAAAIRDSTEATRKSIDATRSSAEQANIDAKANLNRELAIRRVTLAQLEQAKLLAQNADTGPTGGGPGAAGSVVKQLYRGRVAELEKQLKEQNQLVKDAETRIQQTRVDLAFETAEQQSTAVGRVTRAYDQQISALERTVRAQVSAGKKIDATLTREITLLKQKRQAAIDAANEQERASNRATGPTTRFVSPVDGGRVTSGFGPRRAPTAGASTFHKGIDIAAPTGTPVKAAAGGVIIHAGRLGGLGNAIIVDHGGGTITEYGHLSQVLVQRGNRVGQGQQIGAVGSTGISTGPHLDYRVKRNGKYVDPRTGRFATDETAVDLQATRAAEAAEAKRQREAEAKERRAEQERDFVTGVEDQAATRGLGTKDQTVKGQIAKALADFQRRFDREANRDEAGRITKALTDADARETADHFDTAYVQPLARLKALQGQTGIDRDILNAKLEESTRLGRELTPVEAANIENSFRQGDALQRQVAVLESIRGPQRDYAAQIATLNELLAKGAITQTAYNARIADLGSTARGLLGDMPGRDPTTGMNYEDLAARADEDARYAAEQAALQNNRQQLLSLGISYDALVEAAHQRHVDRLNQIDQARKAVAIGAAQSTSESLLSIAQDGFGQQSGIYKALFAVSKAFAIADSVIKIQQGIANALSLPFPANIGAVATVAAQAASIVSSIQAVTLAFADGGKVRGRGGPRDDKINANLSDGEYVVKAAAVARPGNEAMLDAMNRGSLTAGTRRASNDNRAAAGLRYEQASGISLSFGDVIVQGGNGSEQDGQQFGRQVGEQLRAAVRAELKDQMRNGGLLTKTRTSVMRG